MEWEGKAERMNPEVRELNIINRRLLSCLSFRGTVRQPQKIPNPASASPFYKVFVCLFLQDELVTETVHSKLHGMNARGHRACLSLSFGV